MSYSLTNIAKFKKYLRKLLQSRQAQSCNNVLSRGVNGAVLGVLITTGISDPAINVNNVRLIIVHCGKPRNGSEGPHLPGSGGVVERLETHLPPAWVTVQNLIIPGQPEA